MSVSGGGSADPPPPCPPDSYQKRPQDGSKWTQHPAKINRKSNQNRRQNQTEISHFRGPGGSGEVRGRPGASWGGSRGRLGGSRGRLGASGDRLGGVLGPSWGVPGPSLGGLGPSWGGLGRLLGPSWGVRGRPGGVLGASWGRLGASRGRLERHLLASFSELVLGAVLGPISYPCWTIFGPLPRPTVVEVIFLAQWGQKNSPRR